MELFKSLVFDFILSIKDREHLLLPVLSQFRIVYLNVVENPNNLLKNIFEDSSSKERILQNIDIPIWYAGL